ncbi:MAG: 30S ribosomal protein S6 [Syntrophaceae bacterium]
MYYELMMIINPDLGADEIEKVTARFAGNVTKNLGEVIRIDDLGIKNMAYKIQKRSRGHYLLAYIGGPGPMLSEIERTLKIDENIVRFIIIKLPDDVKREDLEKAKVEEETAAKEESAPEAQTPQVTETPAEEVDHGEK